MENNKLSKILGVDYGRSKIGLAVTEGKLAYPWKVIRVRDVEDAVSKIREIVLAEEIGKIVVGVSEGEMGAESKRFADRIGAVTFDETLTSQEAQRLSIEAGVKKTKRKEMEDAFAASIMLQNFLDSFPG